MSTLAARPATRREMGPGTCSLRYSFTNRSVFDGKFSHIPRNFHLPLPAQARHFEKELIPGEFRVASHQVLKITFGGASEEFKDLVGNGLLL